MSKKNQNEVSENVSEKITLEEKLEKLESTIESLEADDISLEMAFDLYQKGMNLVKECYGEINDVEGKILSISEDGELKDFE